MKKRDTLFYGISLITLFLLSACKEEAVKDSANGETPSFTFENSAEGWTGGFADYPVSEDDFYEISFEWAPLPAPLDQSQKALEISGNNHSDDLFMFVKRKIEDLQPSTSYQLTFSIELASNAPDGSFGIGGSPANSVYLKAGATQEEPKAVQQDGEWQMNIDKGNQSQGGEDMLVLGDIATDKEDFEYALISRSNVDNPLSITSDGNGVVWVIIGTDSGFEGITTLYYNQIDLEFEKVSEE